MWTLPFLAFTLRFMLDEFIEEVRREFPKFAVVHKRDSLLMHAIHGFLLVLSFGALRQFMTGFTTTIGTTVYVTDAWSQTPEVSRVIVLRHERVHMRQARRWSSPLYALLYLFVFFPVGLAYFRAKFEKEAYEETIAATVALRGADHVRVPAFREAIIRNFTSSAYMFMWPFRRSLENWYDAAVSRALNHQA